MTEGTGEVRESTVSAKLAMVFAGLLGLLTLLNGVNGLKLVGDVTDTARLVLLEVFLFATALSSLAGVALLAWRVAAGIAAVVGGAVVGVLMVVTFFILDSIPPHGGLSQSGATLLGGVTLLAVLAFVQALRRGTQIWVGRA
ncbi:hypothetical protein [Amycolatopsis sp. CA-230715]|uniref:hypothetical protein n=1 Tax=Amycolatopsis sp. CA-230715 TaxID=2745196 RepID=UPI001C01F966|nr:hypothetical protein [Amycolatopsis sp. CA-230715]QWF77598.1 hypothetical protein HUW46_00990 [Amycolatopsis sp. CA-230715]